jgi:putative spermidine/putrescine transport system substrate-binding protein
LKSAGIATAIGASGCIAEPGSGSNVSEDNPLRIGLSAGAFREIYTEQIVDPFTEETGIPTESVEMGNPPQAFPNFASAVENGEAPVDVFLNTAPTTLRGINSDMWHNYDQGRFENLEYFEDRFVETVDGQLVGAPSQGWFLNLVHNTEVMSDNPPTAWEDLWSSEYEDSMAIYNLANTNYLIDITARLYFDGYSTLETDDGVEEVLEKLAEIKSQVNLWFDSGSSALQRLKQGDIPAGQYYHDVTYFEAQDGAPLASVFAEEGSILSYGHFSVLRTSEKTDAAADFLDYSMRPEIQDNVGESLFTTPLIERKHSSLDDETYENIAGPGPGEAIRPFFDLYTGGRSEFVREKWNEFILQ